MVMFSAGHGDAGAKDTVANIMANGEFVVHIVSHEIRDKMNVCAIAYPHGIDEIEKAFASAGSSGDADAGLSQRLLATLPLKGLHWINFNRQDITLTTLLQ